MRLGIDLGGTKIEGVVLDPEGRERARERMATPRGDYAATIAAVAELVERLNKSSGHRARRVGLGVPGSISPSTGLIRNANSTWLNGRPFDQDLEAALGIPVRLANDANCFALSEAVDGAGKDANIVFGVILGTGVGGGLIAGRRIVGGLNGIGGEWGHNPLPWPRPDETPGPLCWCGKRGCIETWCSGPALSADYERRTATACTADEIAVRAGAGDRAAQDCLADHAERLSRALALVVNIVDPDAIVLGGGLSNLSGLAEALEAGLKPHCFSDAIQTPVRRNVHGAAGGVRGAAWLWPGGDP